MPGFDGTGPLGLGPMTGHGMGYCVCPKWCEKILHQPVITCREEKYPKC